MLTHAILMTSRMTKAVPAVADGAGVTSMQIACRPPARERSSACMELVPARLVKELNKSKIGKRDLFCIYIYYFSGVGGRYSRALGGQ